MTRRIILAVILLPLLQSASAQTAEQQLKKALQKFPQADIHNYKWIELDGKKQLFFPVSVREAQGKWMLYNASAEKPVLDEQFAFILDYVISNTQSGILFKDNNNNIGYRSWPGLPGQGTPTEVPIDFLHQNRFQNDYVGITEPGAKQPAYLHISGRKEALTGLPDSSILLPFNSAKFQLAKPPGPGPVTLLLVDKTVHAWYASVQPQPEDTYLVENDGKYWYLRFFQDKLDSAGPFTYAENFDEGQEYGVVKDKVEGFKVLSLRSFKLYPVPKKANETIDTLIHLKGSREFVCRYSWPGVRWSLLETDGTSLDKTVDSLLIDGRRNIKSVFRSGVLLSLTVASAEFIPDIKTPKAVKGVIDNLDFNSIDVRTYSYEEETKTGSGKSAKTTKTTHRVHTLIGNVAANPPKRAAYFSEDLRAFQLIRNDIEKLQYHGGRFFIAKNKDDWHITDLQTGNPVDPPDRTKIVWLTEFIGLHDKASTFYTACLLRRGGKNEIEYMDNEGNLVQHADFLKAKNLSK